MNPFEFINSITYSKDYLIDKTCEEKDYVPFLINKGLSYYPDTVHYANMMNKYHILDKKLQYDFLLNIVSKKKRYSKWFKSEKSEDIKTISEYYNISLKESEDYLSILTEEQLDIIRNKLSKGGRENVRKGKC